MLFTQMSEEVTERTIISVTPEIIKANGGVGKNSAAKANPKASPSPSNSDEKLLPHYLRASTGSCHDFCKYGRKHAFEAKERRLIRPTFLGNNEITDEEHNQVKVINLKGRRKKQVPKLKTTSQTKVVESDKHKSSARKGLSLANRGKIVRTHLSTASPVNISLESAEHTLPDRDEELSDEAISVKEMIPSPNEGSIISDGNKSSSKAGGSSKEPISIKLMMPSPIDESYIPDGNASSSQAPGVSGEPINLKLEVPSAMKENIDFTDFEPANLAEGSLEKQVKMNLQTPPNEKSFTSADDAPANGAEGSSKEPVMIKVTSLSSIKGIMASAEPTSSDGMEGSSEGSMSMESETPPSIQCSSGDGEHLPTNPAEDSSREPLCINVKTPSSTEKPLASRKPTSTKLRTPSHIQKKPAFLGHTVTQTRSEQDHSWGNTVERKKKQVIKLKSTMPPKTEFSGKSKVLKQKEIGAFAKPDISLQKTVSPVKKTMTTKLIRQKSLSSVKTIISSTKPISIKKNTSSLPSGEDFTPGSSISAKPKTSVVKTTSLLVPSGGLAGRKKLQNKVTGSVGLSKNGEEKTLKPLRTSLFPKTSAGGVSRTKLRKDTDAKPAAPVKNQASVRKEVESHENVKEKTLYVVSLKPVKKSSKSVQHKPKNNKTSLSTRSLHDEEVLEDDFESTSTEGSEPIVGSDGLKDKKQAEHSKYEDRKRLGRTASVQPQAEMSAPHKLKFRRGKVVNPQSENNGPRRLRFRQARVVSENQNGKGEAEKKSFPRRKDLGGAGSNESKLDASAVLLRHQDQQDKKDTQGLFNHVIEETASKLVETRKSKVKALVGAFETVISLQESKVAPTV